MKLVFLINNILINVGASVRLCAHKLVQAPNGILRVFIDHSKAVPNIYQYTYCNFILIVLFGVLDGIVYGRLIVMLILY